MKKTIGAKGFTLVELLVVIAIIGMLVGLLLPAVQQAREAARTMQCSNQLKQMGLAALNHESTNKAFPSCGWSCDWEGDPDFGFGPNQPGSWCYSLLPFLEQNALWQLGSDGDKSTGGEIKNANTTRLKTPISIFYCPSRRPPNLMNGHTAARNNNAFTGGVAKSDYAANGGDGILNTLQRYFQRLFWSVRNVLLRILCRIVVLVGINSEHREVAGMSWPHPVVCIGTKFTD